MKETYYTVQGEGAQTGRAAVFLRFSGCNLWSGREVDRERAVCTFCDTDFVGTDGPGGGVFASATELASHVASIWGGKSDGQRYVVCTGGEPLLQLDTALIDALHAEKFDIAIETNGTLPVPDGVDWVCVSPKADAELAVRSGDELKLVYPQEMATPDQFAALDFKHFFLQPMDGRSDVNTLEATLSYCKESPQWRISLQTHKLINIP